MAGWAVDWSTEVDGDWTLVANVTDFQKAFNERDQALTGTDKYSPLVIAGDDIQARSLWKGMQSTVAGWGIKFAISHDNGTPRAAEYYDGAPEISVYGLAEIFSAAGLAHSNWRRYTTHPDDGGSDLGGEMQVGDIIGPWVFEDIQATLNVLVWPKSTGAWTANGELSWFRSRGVGDPRNRDNNIQVCRDNWWEDEEIDDRRPRAQTQADGLIAEMFRRNPYPSAIIEDFRIRDIEWYGFILAQNVSVPQHFDAQGDGVIFETYKMSSTESGVNGDGGTYIGSDRWLASRHQVELPNFLPEFPSPPQSNGNPYGYEVQEPSSGVSCVLLERFNITGGFEYV